MLSFQKALRAARKTPPWSGRKLRPIPVIGPAPNGCGVYLITDKIEKKVYVGVSCHLWDRYLQHCRRLSKEIWPAPMDRWSFRVLRFFNHRADAYAYEKKILSRLKPRLTSNRNIYISHPYVPTGKPRGRPRKGT